MAHNAYVLVGGVWATHHVLTSAEMATFDLRQFQAVNGDLGGTWAPSTQITLGGSGLAVTGPLTFTNGTIPTGGTLNVAIGGTLTVSGAESIFGSLQIKNFATFTTQAAAPSTFSGDADFNGAVTLNGATTYTGTGHHITGTMNVNGGASIGLSGSGGGASINGAHGSNVVLGGAFTCSLGSTADFDGTTTLGGNSSVTGPLAVSGAATFTGSCNVSTGSFLVGTSASFGGSSTTTFQTSSILNLAGTTNITGVCNATTITAGTLEATSLLHLSGTGGCLFNSGTSSTIQGTLALDGAVTRSAKETRSGTGAYTNVRITSGVDANHTYDGREFDVLTIPTLTTARQYKFSDLGASDRVEVTIDGYRTPLAFLLVLADAAGTTLPHSTFPLTVNQPCSIKLLWNGGSWAVVGYM